MANLSDASGTVTLTVPTKKTLKTFFFFMPFQKDVQNTTPLLLTDTALNRPLKITTL